MPVCAITRRIELCGVVGPTRVDIANASTCRCRIANISVTSAPSPPRLRSQGFCSRSPTQRHHMPRGLARHRRSIEPPSTHSAVFLTEMKMKMEVPIEQLLSLHGCHAPSRRCEDSHRMQRTTLSVAHWLEAWHRHCSHPRCHPRKWLYPHPHHLSYPCQAALRRPSMAVLVHHYHDYLFRESSS